MLLVSYLQNLCLAQVQKDFLLYFTQKFYGFVEERLVFQQGAMDSWIALWAVLSSI